MVSSIYRLSISLFIFRAVLEEVTNRITERHFEGQAFKDDCNIIDSPPAFGAFDLGINRMLNEQSPIYQSLRTNMKVSFEIYLATNANISFMCYLKFQLPMLSVFTNVFCFYCRLSHWMVRLSWIVRLKILLLQTRYLWKSKEAVGVAL